MKIMTTMIIIIVIVQDCMSDRCHLKAWELCKSLTYDAKTTITKIIIVITKIIITITINNYDNHNE